MGLSEIMLHRRDARGAATARLAAGGGGLTRLHQFDSKKREAGTHHRRYSPREIESFGPHRSDRV
jgi:hypothetical protein